MALDRMVVFCFNHYEAIKRAVYEKRLDPGTQKQGGGGHSYISDPTAQKAIRNTAELDVVTINYGSRESQAIRRPESWLRVVERTRAYYGSNIQGQMIVMLYDKKAGWREICRTLKLRRSVYYTLMNDVISIATGIAIGLGLNGGVD